MDRRGFITVMAAGGSMTLFPALLSGCGASVQRHKELEPNLADLRLKLISCAMLAPNSHNIQPWLVKLTGENRFDLYVDQTRLLLDTDPPSRQIHISQGAFLETLRIAASGVGYRSEITYFPRGMYSNSTIVDKPVASIRLIPDPTVPPDPLLDWLRVRQSNKRVYKNKEIPQQDLNELRRHSQGGNMRTSYADDPELLSRLSSMVGDAMAIESSDFKRNQEIVRVFRFSEQEALETRDGFTLANNGITGLKRFLAEAFFLGDREQASIIGSSFMKEGVKTAYKQAESAAAFGWIVSESNTRRDQLKVGELYTRINLWTAKLGIGLHPMNQLLEEYEDMKTLQTRFRSLLNITGGKKVQMLFRLGYADAVPHTKRRFTGEIIG